MAQGMKAKSKAKIFNSWEDDGIPGTRASNPGDDCWGMKAKSVGEILNKWEDSGLPAPRAAWTVTNLIVSGTASILSSLAASYISVNEIRAAATQGLMLYDDAGTAGIFVQDGGNVGIGTMGPGAKLHVQDVNFAGAAALNTHTKMVIEDSSGAYLEFSSDGVQGLIFSDDVSGRGSFVYNQAIDALEISTAGTSVMLIDSNGNVGIGTTGPDRLLHAEVADAATAAVAYAVRLSHITSAAATTDFGVGYEIELEDGGGTNRVVAYHETTLTEATATAWAARSAVRMADVAGTYECLRTEASGAAMIGFLGVAAAARQAAITDAVGSPAVVDPINAIIAALETFGLIAT